MIFKDKSHASQLIVMATIRSNRSFWRTSTGPSTLTSLSQSEEVSTEFLDSNTVNPHNSSLQVNSSNYTTASPQALLNWPAQNFTFDEIKEPAVNFWQQPQVSLDEMALQPASYSGQLDTFPESNTDCQSPSLHTSRLFLMLGQDIQPASPILEQQQSNGNEQQMQTEMMSRVDELRQHVAALQEM